MASLSPISDQMLQPTSSSGSDLVRRKRRNISTPRRTQLPPSLERWKSGHQQRIYSMKLVRALKEVRISRSSESAPSSTPSRVRAVREAVYRALAVAGRGRTLWSRAILANRSVKLKVRKQKRQRASNPAAEVTGRKQRGTVLLRLKRKKSLPVIQRKVKVLSRLVPGCRKQQIPIVLEESADYIAAMQMQISAMTAILKAVGSASTSPSSGHDGEQTHVLG